VAERPSKRDLPLFAIVATKVFRLPDQVVEDSAGNAKRKASYPNVPRVFVRVEFDLPRLMR
jgi:hypothetical protein